MVTVLKLVRAASTLLDAGGSNLIIRRNCLATVSTAQILDYSGLQQLRAVWRVVNSYRPEGR